MPGSIDPQFTTGVGASPEAPTTASSWKSPRKEGFDVTLPSGNVAKVRRSMDILELIKSGKVPNRLIGLITRMMDDQQEGKIPEIPAEDVTHETLTEMMSFIDSCVASIMISPPCRIPPRIKNESTEDYMERAPSWDPPEGTISIFDLTPEDRMFLFTVAQGGTADLEAFREQPPAAVVASPARKSVPRATKRTARPKG